MITMPCGWRRTGYVQGAKRFMVAAAAAWLTLCVGMAGAAERFEGKYFRGQGDTEFLQLLDTARRLFEPNPEMQHLAMLYTPVWNGLVEGPTWGAWWIQNSYGPSYCALPFLEEPFVTFLQNSQDLWFDQMGDGKRAGKHGWVAPDGCLCDAAAPNWVVYRQGDGRIEIHDWALEFTAAGIVLQAEALLISRDMQAIARYLPKLERSAEFIESRRDAKTNLFLAGPAANLLAPSYAGWKKPDGTYDKAYLTGLSITYIAALDRLIELEKLVGNSQKVVLYMTRRDLARRGLPLVTAEEGYFIKSLDPDGTRHGVHGARQHGYFEAVCNHDAICFRVADDEQAQKIYRKLSSIWELRRNDLIITNAPSLDDMYAAPRGLWEYGRWVNGGHWSTCEARAIMAYYRLGKHDDARKSMRRILDFYRRFRADNPLVAFGGDVYQPQEPINCVYDTWGIPAAMIRGLFEYLYKADELLIIPHIPPRIVELEQRFAIRWGPKRLYLSTRGSGPVTGVQVNGRPWPEFDATTVRLAVEKTPDHAAVQILLGGAEPRPLEPPPVDRSLPPPRPVNREVLRSELFPIISGNDLPLRIGSDSNGQSRFVGDIGRVRLYSRALKPEEVAALARRQPGPLERDPALVADWKFDQSRQDNLKQTVFPNALGEHLPARAIGEVHLAEGPQGKVLRLAGKGYLEVAHDPRLNLVQNATLEAWIRPAALRPGGGRILDKSRAGTANGYLLDIFPGNSLRMIVEWGSPQAATRAAADQWIHVAGTVAQDGTLALYANGKPIATQKANLPPEIAQLEACLQRLRTFHQRMVEADLGDRYEAAHARLAIRAADAALHRLELLAQGKISRLPERSQTAADRSYFTAAARLCDGLVKVLQRYPSSPDPLQQKIGKLWE